MENVSLIVKGQFVTIGINTNQRDLIKKEIIQLDKCGNEIARYNSIYEAEKQTGILHIYECVNHKRKTAGGYIWAELKEIENG